MERARTPENKLSKLASSFPVAPHSQTLSVAFKYLLRTLDNLNEAGFFKCPYECQSI